MSKFKKAQKSQSKLRLALFGPSGAGKTFTALRLAKGIGGKTAFIDSERGSASKYADRFEFDTCPLEKRTIDEYVEVINDAALAGYETLVIDSMSHAWQELLEEVDRIAKAKYRGNTWGAWNEGTPKQKKLVNAILDFPGHIIATMRSKTEWSIETSSDGKTKPTRQGLAPEQGKGIEYEFDLLIELSVDHIGNVIKDRSGKFQDSLVEKPDEKFGEQLAEWLSDGDEVTVDENRSKQALAGFIERLSQVKKEDEINQILKKWELTKTQKKLTEEDYQSGIEKADAFRNTLIGATK